MIFKSGDSTSSSTARGALRASVPTTCTSHEMLRNHSSIYMENLPESSIAHLMGVSPLVHPALPNLHLWLEGTRLPYAGYAPILSKQTGDSDARAK